MDVGFLDLADGVVRWVDDRFGRLAAWLTAGLMVMFALALLVAVAMWLLR